jgi:predicted AAA+ superfamily ATPase
MELVIPKMDKNRSLPPPQGSFFLFGPRGTGKSTYLRLSFPKAVYIDFLDPETFRAYSAKPERIRELVWGNAPQKQFILDEIQKVPEVLSVIHELIESNQGYQFILTGSSSRKLKRTGVDLLAGRAILYKMHPFTPMELQDDFDLDHALQFGLLPLVNSSQNPMEVLRSYIGLYIKEEIMMEGLIRNVGNFSRFLETVSFSHASVLNTSNVARESGVERKTAEGYLSVLEDLLLCFFLPVFSKKAKRDLIVHKKFYFFDTGVYASLRPQGILDAPQEMRGPLLEGLGAQILRAHIDSFHRDIDLFYWRTRTGMEVDFVLYGKNIFTAIEVKNSSNIRSNDLKGLNLFLEDYPEASALLLYRGKERLQKGKILCIPVEEFLKSVDDFLSIH